MHGAVLRVELALQVLGLQLKSGRFFTDQDNERFARGCNHEMLAPAIRL
jgi:hypothetical protein